MKIGITCYPTYGGSGAVATELGIALASRGHEVHFVTYQQPLRLPAFVPGVFFHEVEVVRYPLFEYPPYDLALAVRMHDVVRDCGLDLLHVHYAIPHATSAWIAREMLEQSGRSVKVVTTLHGTDITIVGQEPSFRSITKFSIEKSDSITAVSSYLKDETYRAFGCAGCDVEVIPNFVDTSIYNRAEYTGALHKYIGEQKRVLMHTSNFRAVKRVRDVVRIFAGVASKVESVLVMVGDGPERASAEDEVRELGLQSSVFFLGKFDSVAQLLSGADLFLLPSEEESFGLSALEALASGVPVIATNVGGLSEVIHDGVTGRLHEVGDVGAMAESAVEILTDAAKWQQMSAAAANDAKSRFRMEDIVERYEQHYTATLAK